MSSWTECVCLLHFQTCHLQAELRCFLAQKYSGVSTYNCSSDANVTPICELKLRLSVEVPHHFELMLMVVAFCVSPHNSSFHAVRGSQVCFDVLMCYALDVLRSNSKLVLSVHEFLICFVEHSY